MANLNRALQELRQERNRAEREVERLDEAISVVQGLVGGNHLGRTTRPGRTTHIGRSRRKISAAGRRKIAAAQRARWAKLKSKRLQRGKRHMSAFARNRIAHAQRIRWAQLKNKTLARAATNSAAKVQAGA